MSLAVHVEARDIKKERMPENRIGFSFNNPDLTSDHYAPEWGLIVTPDELRYVILFGTRLTSSDQSQTYTDDMLQYYIDNAIGLIEADLQIDIYPRIVRHEDMIDKDTGNRIPRSDIPEDEINVREPGYPYRSRLAKQYLYTALRRRPLQEVMTAKLYDPVMNQIIDMYKWRRERPGLQSVVQFIPNSIGAMAGSAAFPMMAGGINGFMVKYPFDNYPNAIMIDYKTGWPNVKDVPKDLVEIIRMIAGIMLLNDFGDGRSAAIGSQSTSLNSISESFSTTMSATNAMYGARIIQFQKQIKDWWNRNSSRYRWTDFGVL